MKRSPIKPRTKSRPRGTKTLDRNRKRTAENFQRAYGGEEYRAYIVSLPCLICGRTPSDPAHTKNGGVSRKGDACTLVPLCPSNAATGWLGHHTEYDTGKRSFLAKYDVDLAAAANGLWRAYTGDLTPLSAVVPAVMRDLMAKRGEDAC